MKRTNSIEYYTSGTQYYIFVVSFVVSLRFTNLINEKNQWEKPVLRYTTRRTKFATMRVCVQLMNQIEVYAICMYVCI